MKPNTVEMYKGYKMITSSRPGIYIYLNTGDMSCLHAPDLETAKQMIDELLA